MHDLSDERPDVVLTLLDRLKVYNDTAVPCRSVWCGHIGFDWGGGVRERERKRQTDRQRQTDRDREGGRDRQTDR